MSKRTKYSESDLPCPGSVFLAPLEDGRFGVLRVVRTSSQSGYSFVFVVPSSWIGSTPTRPSDANIRLPLILTHHSWANHREALWVSAPPPPSFIPVGAIEITAADHAIQCEAYSSWETVRMQILLQWRWDHDREALLIEETARKAKEANERKIADERRAEMLRTLTLDVVSERTWFETWDEDTEEPNLSTSRRLVSTLIENLRGAPKLTKAVARQMLRTTVKSFNRLDAASRFIETVHREDICDAFEIIMAAARYPDLADEVEKWREW